MIARMKALYELWAKPLWFLLYSNDPARQTAKIRPVLALLWICPPKIVPCKDYIWIIFIVRKEVYKLPAM